MDEFINIELTKKTLARFTIRKNIKSAIDRNLQHFQGKFLDIGCGKMPYKQYLLKNSQIKIYHGLDIESALIYDDQVKPDFFWDGKKMPFQDSIYDSAFGTEVLEHCPYPETILKEVNRVLKPGGSFFFTVPFLWNLHEVPHDEYRYTPFSLQRHLNNSGFSKVNIFAQGGWHASMAQMFGAWIERSPMNGRKRKLVKSIAKPIIRKLNKMDGNPEKIQFKEGQMITGLYGVAFK